MTDFFCKRGNWLPQATKMEVGDIITIHPRDGLTHKDVVAALSAQFPNWMKRDSGPRFYFNEHGTKYFIQRTR